MRLLGDLALSDVVVLVSHSFSSCESAGLLNLGLLLGDESLFISELESHAFFLESLLSGFSLDGSFLLLLLLVLALEVLEERGRADSYVLDVDTLEPHSPSLEQGLQFSGDLAG